MSPHEPVISLIWAMSENRVIGLKDKLPWHLPADLWHFKQLTLGKPILMGRKTWESLPGILPGREHIVLTHDKAYTADGCTLVHSFEQALIMLKDASEVMIIGGAALFEHVLPLADRLYITLVHTTLEGDVYFPPIDLSRWHEIERQYYPADAQNAHALSFINLERKRLVSETG
jgi:dihydrofolate reductase